MIAIRLVYSLSPTSCEAEHEEIVTTPVSTTESGTPNPPSPLKSSKFFLILYLHAFLGVEALAATPWDISKVCRGTKLSTTEHI